MTPDLDAAERFLATRARLLDRLRFAHHLRGAPAAPVLRALDAYRTEDGAVGHALEPDLRTPHAQPAHVLAAAELLVELGAGDHPLVGGLCGWLERVADPDGGVPFVLATARDAPLAPWFVPEDDPGPSLLMTAALAAPLLRLGAAHPVLERMSAFCWSWLPQLDLGAGYEVRAVIAFLDAWPDRERADAALTRLGGSLGGAGVAVHGGTDAEVLAPIDLAPWPGRPARALFADDVLERDVDALAAGQRDDGGWDFTWLAWDPGVTIEWRGRVTVDALRVLRAHGRLEPSGVGAS